MRWSSPVGQLTSNTSNQAEDVLLAMRILEKYKWWKLSMFLFMSDYHSEGLIISFLTSSNCTRDHLIGQLPIIMQEATSRWNIMRICLGASWAACWWGKRGKEINFEILFDQDMKKEEQKRLFNDRWANWEMHGRRWSYHFYSASLIRSITINYEL